MQRFLNLVDIGNADKCAYSHFRSCRYSRERALQNLPTCENIWCFIWIFGHLYLPTFVFVPRPETETRLFAILSRRSSPARRKPRKGWRNANANASIHSSAAQAQRSQGSPEPKRGKSLKARDIISKFYMADTRPDSTIVRLYRRRLLVRAILDQAPGFIHGARGGHTGALRGRGLGP